MSPPLATAIASWQSMPAQFCALQGGHPNWRARLRALWGPVVRGDSSIQTGSQGFGVVTSLDGRLDVSFQLLQPFFEVRNLFGVRRLEILHLTTEIQLSFGVVLGETPQVLLVGLRFVDTCHRPLQKGRGHLNMPYAQARTQVTLGHRDERNTLLGQEQEGSREFVLSRFDRVPNPTNFHSCGCREKLRNVDGLWCKKCRDSEKCVKSSLEATRQGLSP